MSIDDVFRGVPSVLTVPCAILSQLQVTFAVLLGVFIDDISNGVSEFKSGNFPIPEVNHTVVVGSDRSQLVHVLREVRALR